MTGPTRPPTPPVDAQTAARLPRWTRALAHPRDERGSVSILVALLLTVVVLAITLDGGQLLVSRSAQQNAADQAVTYAHGGHCTDTIQFSGNDFSVTGDMHTNGQLKISGNNIAHTGAATYTTSLNISGNQISWWTDEGSPTYPTQVAERTWPPGFTSTDININDFDTGGRHTSRPDYVAASGTTTINNSWLSQRGYLTGGTLTPKIYYTDGDINISGHGVSGSATFVARGDISFSGTNINIEHHFMNLAAFSHKGSAGCGQDAIKLNGNNLGINGVLFAPYGQVSLSGNGIGLEIQGAIISNQVKFSGNDITITDGNDTTTGTGPSVGLDVW